MTRYSVQSRDRILVKGNAFLSFARNMGGNVGKNEKKKKKKKKKKKFKNWWFNWQ